MSDMMMPADGQPAPEGLPGQIPGSDENGMPPADLMGASLEGLDVEDPLPIPVTQEEIDELAATGEAVVSVQLEDQFIEIRLVIDDRDGEGPDLPFETEETDDVAGDVGPGAEAGTSGPAGMDEAGDLS